MKNKIAIIILFIIFIILLILINNLFTKKEISAFKEEKLFSKEKYYIAKNLNKYKAYASMFPETKIKDVIAIINTNANKTAYKDVKKADLTKGILILVNKYHYLEKDYIPSSLTYLNEEYAYKDKQILEEVNEAFKEMYQDALKDNIKFYITSAYRSYSYQKSLYSKYLLTYGEEYTNTISAYPGYSEHQTGLAIDILSENVKMRDFKNTKAFAWLKENSYKYGFILRYPENKTYLTGYAFEPWHYRYVGKQVALQIKDENITFDEYYAYYLDN